MIETGDYYIEFIKGTTNNLDIIDFLSRITQQANNQYCNKHIVIVLDNAKMHKTAYFTNFNIQNNIKALFTIPHHPFFNPVEYLFRFLKTDLRKSLTLY